MSLMGTGKGCCGPRGPLGQSTKQQQDLGGTRGLPSLVFALR